MDGEGVATEKHKMIESPGRFGSQEKGVGGN